MVELTLNQLENWEEYIKQLFFFFSETKYYIRVAPLVPKW